MVSWLIIIVCTSEQAATAALWGWRALEPCFLTRPYFFWPMAAVFWDQKDMASAAGVVRCPMSLCGLVGLLGGGGARSVCRLARCEEQLRSKHVCRRSAVATEAFLSMNAPEIS